MRTRQTIIILGLACMLVVSGCKSVERAPADNTVTDPGFAKAGVVDIAVLPPQVQQGDTRFIAITLRSECRKVLINGKRYALPKDKFVDRILEANNAGPAAAVALLGSDAVLETRITQWDSGPLLPRGRIFAGGEFTLHGKSGVLWRRTFKDKVFLAPGQVTPANRPDLESEIVRSVVREMLSTLPQKPSR